MIYNNNKYNNNIYNNNNNKIEILIFNCLKKVS